MSYKIISIDGGGTYGFVYATILERIYQAYPNLLRNVDLIAGTSVGGIIALLLAYGYTPDFIASLIYSEAKNVFAPGGFFRSILFYMGLCSKYKNDKLRELTNSMFGDKCLRDLGKKVIISSFLLDTQTPKGRHWKAKFFHNFEGEDSDGHEKIVDIAMRTSAAPIILPTVDRYTDGGLVANNPALSAICQTQDPRAIIPNRPTIEDIHILSIGRGKVISYAEGENKDWGLIQWTIPLVNYVYDKDNAMVDFQCRQLIRDRYHRIGPCVDGNIDDTHNLEFMRNFANRFDLSPAFEWLQKHWE